MSPGVAPLVASVVASLGASLVGINLRGRAALPHRSGDCRAEILPTTLRDVGVGA